MMSWISSNWSGVLSIVTAVLAVGVMIANLLHASNVASKLQSIEDGINNFVKSLQNKS
jgi:hypothetical protein